MADGRDLLSLIRAADPPVVGPWLYHFAGSDPGAIKFPLKKFFDDYGCTKPSKEIDLGGWIVPREAFRIMNAKVRYVTHLNFEDAFGVTEEAIEELRGFYKLKVVNFKNAVSLTENVGRVISTWTGLLELNLSGCPITLDGMQGVGLCKTLRTLICQSCPGLDDYVLIAISKAVQTHRRLVNIDLSKNTDYSDEGLLMLIDQGARVLASLNVSNCRKITSLPIVGLRKKMHCLKKLDLSGMTISQSAFEWFPEGCVFLEALNISKCLNLDDEALAVLGKHCKKLTDLNLSRCSNISDRGITLFLENFEGSLEKLDLTGCVKCGAASAEALAEHQKTSLIEVKMNGLSQVSADSLDSLLSNCKTLKRFEISAELRSSCTHRKSMVPHISDRVLLHAHFSKLEMVAMAGAALVSNAGAIALITKCPNLHYLDVSYCLGLSNETLLCLGARAPNLKHLSIAGNGKITNAGIMALTDGCRKLRHLDLSGCSKIGDTGAMAILKCTDLEYLNVRSVDMLTDKPLRVLARFLPKLKFLDISSLDLVGKSTVMDFCTRCPELTVLNCTSCNLIANDLAAASVNLPMAFSTDGKYRLEPRPKCIASFNRYVQDLRYAGNACSVIQRFLHKRYVRKLVVQTRMRELRLVITLQKHFRGYIERRRYLRYVEFMHKTKRNAVILQRVMRRVLAVRAAKQKRFYLLKLRKAATVIQRHFRGHAARKRARRRRLYVMRVRRKLYFFMRKTYAIVKVRDLHRKILKVQSCARRFICFQRYQRIKQGVRELHVLVKRFLAVRRRMHQLVDKFLGQAVTYIAAVTRLSRWLKCIRHNRSIIRFVVLCAQTHWNQIEMALWTKSIQHKSSIVIQRAARDWRWRRYKAFEEANKKAFIRAAIKVQSAWRAVGVRRWYKKWRLFKKRVAARWRLIVAGSLHRMRMINATKIQRLARRFLFLRMRDLAARRIQRMERGRQARVVVRAIIAAIREDKAGKLQRVWHKFAARQQRKRRIAREHMCAFKIQQIVRYRQEMKRRLAAARAALIAKQIGLKEEKKHLIEKKKMRVVNAFEEGVRHDQVRMIQRCWQRYKVRKEHREKQAVLQKEQAESIQRATKAQEQLKADSSLLHKVMRMSLDAARSAIKLAKSVTETVQPAELVTDEEERRLIVSVTKFQTLSMQQVGICDICMTFGETRMHAFQQKQNLLRSTKKPYYTMVPGDLSGYLNLGIFLWTKPGKGTECICELVVQDKPKDSVVALNTRQRMQSFKGVQIAWNESVHVEVHGVCSLKQGRSGFAISSMRICGSLDEGLQAQKDGYRMEVDMMKFNFPTSIWISGMMQDFDEDSVFDLGIMPQMPWYSPRADRCIKMYNLSVRDVTDIKDVFDRSRRGYDPKIKTARVIDIFEFMRIPYTQIGEWIVNCITPTSLRDLLFCEYLHLVCCIVLMSKKEILRLIFGTVCDHKHQTINKEVFERVIEQMTEGMPGQRNIRSLQRKFMEYANPKLEVMFFKGFEGFVDEHPRMMWMFQQLQDSFRQRNLGEAYWQRKIEQFKYIRTSLGIEAVD